MENLKIYGTDGKAVLERDQQIGISFKDSGVFVFDRETGERYL